ncbi:DUF2441 domain-containing protein [Lelliottia wanjuensis]|uniref:DUF2441 domain-containing protein n=1 Tax=Lelliottia wanjuensis TaxID=3050585 RepID=A0AAP4FZG9_9ENTR|nr:MULTISPECIES: DUF2441 domain-containing protein [unclassified Lelliottia]MDK9366440.1 DUF2441 domain-containing protein [Lelliottia sp. V106_12]MDK9618691.1 DUF2441 domain-containing protein [Lelliottia sp. V106_9]
MAIYYTLDRSAQCESDQIFTYEMIAPNDWLRNDDGTLMGFAVSRHGKQYLNGSLHNNPNSNNVAIEFIFELIRRQHFPDKTTRFCCMFAAETLEGAQAFRATTQWNRPYKIFSIEHNGPIHRGDMNLLSSSGNMFEVERRAMAYWCGETYEMYPGYQPYWEILIPLPVRMGKIVQNIA